LNGLKAGPRSRRPSTRARMMKAMLPNWAVLAEGLPEIQAVVARSRFGEQRKAAVAPVEGAGIDDHAADGGAVTADPLGRRLHHDVGPCSIGRNR
jgi:hypothetical protein